MPPSNNGPEVQVGLTRDQAEFLVKNCEANQAFGLTALQDMRDEGAARAMVALIEQFKAIAAATKEALK